jgi:hypothetical protein
MIENPSRNLSEKPQAKSGLSLGRDRPGVRVGATWIVGKTLRSGLIPGGCRGFVTGPIGSRSIIGFVNDRKFVSFGVTFERPCIGAGEK